MATFIEASSSAGQIAETWIIPSNVTVTRHTEQLMNGSSREFALVGMSPNSTKHKDSIKILSGLQLREADITEIFSDDLSSVNGNEKERILPDSHSMKLKVIVNGNHQNT